VNIFTVKTIREEEGKSLKVYQDTLGNLTVGIGHKVLQKDNLALGATITEERCEELFWADLKTTEKGARHILKTLSGRQPWEILHALNCMVFQLGSRGTWSFVKTLAAMSRRDYAAAEAEMLDSRWAREQTPARAVRLATFVGDLTRRVDFPLGAC
jgi:GH24 family phage-related lysozyme (muramidase)